MTDIRFGTDGWRGVIARDFTFANLDLVVQAVAAYLKEEGPGGAVVMGYDCRFLSEEFAAGAAEVLAGNGLEVRLVSGPTPTPVVAWAVRRHRAAGALMVTASHNPPTYQGVKFIPAYAGPAEPEITRAIEERLALLNSPRQVVRTPLERARREGLVRELEPREDYLAHLRGMLRLEPLKRRRLRVVVDPLYGAGSGYLDDFLAEQGLQVELLHGQRDAFFGGTAPDPTAQNLAALADTVVEEGADIGLATDGDADRFGVVDAGGRYVPANRVLALVFYHLLLTRGWRQGTVARTLATTHLLDRVARHFGLGVEETPVGFKYIGRALRGAAVFGGEESGGLSLRGHVPEKDGILATALVAELVAEHGSLRALEQRLAAEVGLLDSRRWDLVLEEGGVAAWRERLAGYAPAKLGGQPVRERLALDGVKLVLADGSWVLLRPSGTEPVLRVYVEAPGPERVEDLYAEVRRDLGL